MRSAGCGSSLGYEGISPATGVAFNLYSRSYGAGLNYAPHSVSVGTFSYQATGLVNFDSMTAPNRGELGSAGN